MELPKLTRQAMIAASARLLTRAIVEGGTKIPIDLILISKLTYLSVLV